MGICASVVSGAKILDTTTFAELFEKVKLEGKRINQDVAAKCSSRPESDWIIVASAVRMFVGVVTT